MRRDAGADRRSSFQTLRRRRIKPREAIGAQKKPRTWAGPFVTATALPCAGGLKRLRHPGHEAFETLQPLGSQLAVQFADPARLGNEGLIGLPRELGLKLKSLVERAHADELLEEGPGLLERLPGKVAICVRDRLKVDRVRFHRSSLRGYGGCGRSSRLVGQAERSAGLLTNVLAACF